MSTLLHFTATWAEAICGPHRLEVAEAANALGLGVREVDVDAEPDLARRYDVMNVPAVAIEGQIAPIVVGAATAERLVVSLRGSRA